MKRFLGLLAVGLWIASTAVAGDSILRLALSRTAASLPALRMVETDALGPDVALEFDVWAAPEQLLAMAQKGGHQYYVLPLTLAARLYAKDVPIRLTNVSVWGGIAVVSSDPAVRTWQDLAGRLVAVPPQSSPPDALLAYFLRRAGVDASSLRLVRATIPEIAQLVRSGRVDTGLLMEPQLAAALSGEVRVAIDFETEWRSIHGPSASIPSLGFGATADFLRDHPDLAARFEAAYAEAVEWVVTHPAEAGALAERYLSLPADLIEQAMPGLGLRYQSAREARAAVDPFFAALVEVSPAILGGKAPDAAFYH